MWLAYFKSSPVHFSFSSPGRNVTVHPFPLPDCSHLCPSSGPVPCPFTAGMKQEFLVHLEHTSHPRLSGGTSGSSFFSFRDVSGSPPSLENTRWDGWRQFCRKCCEIGFLSGLSSWKQSGQKTLRSQPSFIASRATDGFPKHLKSVPLPWTEYAASCRKSFVCPQRNSDPNFLLP